MLAILGLIGVAVSAFAVMDTNSTDDDMSLEGNGDGDTMGAHDAAPPIVPITDILPDDASETGETVTIPDEGGAPLFTGDGGDTVTGGAADDYVQGRAGDDTISGNAGSDELHGGADNDRLDGGSGNDTLIGHVGDDTLLGDEGDDVMQGGDGHDTLDGGDGADRMQGYLGNDTLITGNGSDVAYGGAGDDHIDGRDDGSKDFLNGGAGDDRILSGIGDYLTGGTGDDTFVFETTGGGYVGDFVPGEDLIEVVYSGDTPPELSTQPAEGGLELLADGEVLAKLAGVETLDLTKVSLVAA